MLIRSILVALALSLTACGSGAEDPGLDNRGFRLSVPTSTVTEQEREDVKVYLAAIGAGDRPVTFSLHDGPAYARGSQGNLLTLSPQVGDAGVAAFSVSASDGVHTDTGVLTVEVTPLPNQLPVISGNFGILNEDMTFLFYDAGMGHYSRGEPSFRLHAADPEGDAYRLFVEVRPEGELFQRTPTHESVLVPSGDVVIVPLTGLVEGQRYKLQWRLEDERGARMRDWYFSGIDVSVWTVTDL